MTKKISIVVMSPEVYGLPDNLSPLSKIVQRRSGGGMGDVVKMLIDGLYERKVDVHYLGPNYKKIFFDEAKRQSGMDHSEYFNYVHQHHKKRIHLINSKEFSNLDNIYQDTIKTSSTFQDLVISSFVNDFSTSKNRKVIFHGHDQFAGLIPAYLKSINLPYVHHLHNLHTEFINFSEYSNFDFSEEEVVTNICRAEYITNEVVDTHGTAIKNASSIITVGHTFTNEVISGVFDSDLTLYSSRQTIKEIKEKSKHDQIHYIPNAISECCLPEKIDSLYFSFDPNSNSFYEQKEKNKLQFQKEHSLDISKDNMLVGWTSRLDNYQKGIEDLIENMPEFLDKYGNIQFAIVADPPLGQEKYQTILKNYAKRFEGRVYYSNFDKKESDLLYIASDLIVGASRREPFGLYMLQAICNGSLPVVPNNGGSLDIVRNISDENIFEGNGVVYEGFGTGNFRNGLKRAVSILELQRQHPELLFNNRFVGMKKARQDFHKDKFIDSVLEVYDGVAKQFGLYDEGHSFI